MSFQEKASNTILWLTSQGRVLKSVYEDEKDALETNLKDGQIEKEHTKAAQDGKPTEAFEL